MEREMPEEWGKPIDQRCQYVDENGKQCDRTIDGQGGWRYCKECRPAAQKKAKSQRDAQRRKGDDKRAEDNYYHWLHDHGLTEPQLRRNSNYAHALRELWPAARDDQHDLALNKFQDIMGLFLYDPSLSLKPLTMPCLEYVRF